jgi:hypothetical protein
VARRRHGIPTSPPELANSCDDARIGEIYVEKRCGNSGQAYPATFRSPVASDDGTICFDFDDVGSTLRWV